MNNDFVKKHLARNVPKNFNECCDRIRREFFLIEDEARKRGRRLGRGRERISGSAHDDPLSYDVIYGGMISMLFEGEIDPDKETEIGLEIFEVEVRFGAIQRTIDFSVPAKPIYDVISRLARTSVKVEKALKDEHRETNVRGLMELADDELMPNTIAEFEVANSLAERAVIAEKIVAKFSSDMEIIKEFFDYKNGMVTRGQPALYSTLYVVHALADIFERHDQQGRSANINETLTTSQKAEELDTLKSRRYTGPFLDFVTIFYQIVDFAEMQRRQKEGFQDAVRNFAKGRQKDRKLIELLHGTVTVENILEFMKRADDLKK